MRDVLQHLNDALEGPEVELERWYKFWMLFPLLNSYEHRRAGDDEAMD
jgi:hypothetical protein